MGRLLAFLLALPAAAFASADRTVDRWGVEEGLRNNALTSIIQTRDGYLWIGSWAGIVRFDGALFTNVADDLPNVHARVLLEDQDGSVWVGTSGGGVVRWRPGRIEAFTTTQGLAGNDVRALAQDAGGRTWVGTEAGLSVIDAGRISTWRREHGLMDNAVTSLAPGSEGRVWVTTARSVCEVRDERLRCIEPRPPMGPLSAVLEIDCALGRGTRLVFRTPIA